MGVIAYDRPVRDFIAGLNATGHVTHTKHRKTKVTLHHNGGRLSLEGILRVWETRPASAHFQVDGAGNVGQYVLPNEYAWATGTTKGNQDSISIEMANSTLSPDWVIAGATTYNAARLGGWLFAKVIGTRPTKDTLVVHHYWKATTCAGPFIDRVYPTVLRQTQEFYDMFTGAVAPRPAPVEERNEDMSVRLMRGNSTQQIPGKNNTWGDLQFMVQFDPALPFGAVRRYMTAGGVQRVLEQAQGGVDVVDQDELDMIPYTTGGEPPASVTG